MRSSLHRRDDTTTAIEAAEKILPRINDLQYRVLDAFRRYHRRTFGQGATDGEIEALPEFSDLRPTTVRKRRLELVRKGYLRATKNKRAGMTVFVPVSQAEMLEEIQAQRERRLF